MSSRDWIDSNGGTIKKNHILAKQVHAISTDAMTVQKSSGVLVVVQKPRTWG